jgi:hypothetical protein
MRLKIYGPKGYPVSVDFRVIVGWKRKSHRVHDSNAQNPHSRRQLTRVNSANIQDEGLMIGGRGRRMNSKVKIRQTRRGLTCIENKRGTQLSQSQSVPGQTLLAHLYRWPGLEEPIGFNTNYNDCIRCHLVFRLYLCLGLPNRPQGYQDNEPY